MFRRKGVVIGFLIMVVLLTGCNENHPSQIQQGTLEILLNVPEQFVPQFMEHQITLSSISVTITKDTYTKTQVVDVTGGAQQITFDALDVGEWQVDVLVKDSDGYDVYESGGVATVSGNSNTDLSLTLDMAPGDLNIAVNLPTDLEVVTGTVKLTHSISDVNELVENLIINGSVGTATFSDITPTTWPLEIELFDSQEIRLLIANDQVDVLPGRVNNISYTLTSEGSLTLLLDWEEPPTTPSGLSATWQAGNVVLTWTANSEVDLSGYLIYRSDNLSGKKILLNERVITNNQFTDQTATLGNNYYFWVQAFDTMGYSSLLSDPVNLAGTTGDYQFVYGSMRDGIEQIYLYDTVNLTERNITDNSYHCYSFDIASDGSSVAYVSMNGTTSYDIYLKDLDGTNLFQLTNTTNMVNAPAWSPNSSRVAYNSDINGYTQIISIDRNGTNLTQLTSTAADDFDAVWAPNGSKIGFLSSRMGNTDIVVANTDGSAPVLLTSGRDIVEFSWSPDGTKIAFLEQLDITLSNISINMMDATGANEEVILNNNNPNVGLEWSPDGTKLVFTFNDGVDNEVAVINSDGTNYQQLTDNELEDTHAYWTPDGQYIVYLSDDEIWMMSPDGTGKIQVTNDGYSKYDLRVVGN